MAQEASWSGKQWLGEDLLSTVTRESGEERVTSIYMVGEANDKEQQSVGYC